MTTLPESKASDKSRSCHVNHLAGAIERVLERELPKLQFGEIEAVLLEASNEAVRRVLERQLQQLADSFGDLVRVRDNVYRRHQPGSKRYFSLCGPLNVTRYTYRLVSKRNGPTCVPMELAAGLALDATPALSFALAQGHAKAPVRSVEQDLHAAYRRPPSRATMDRIARQLGAYANHEVDEIEPHLRAQEEVPAAAFALNIGLDRTSIPMEEAADGEPSKSGIKVRYRMAYVGTVCITDRNCQPLFARRYAAPAHEDPERLIGRMIADVTHVLARRPDLNVGIVQDNAPELWNRLREAMRAAFPRLRWRETVDRWHLMERLAGALEVLYGGKRSDALRKEKYDEWSRAIEKSDAAVPKIAKWIHLVGRSRSDRDRNELHRLMGVYTLCEQHFRYASLKKLGLHSGSGVTEGACKSLIAMRAKRSGQRWRVHGISSVLALRTLLDSERLEAFWPLFLRRFHANCNDMARAA